MSSSLRNLTGWRAVLAAIGIVALVGWRGWNRTPHYRTVGSGTWEVAAGRSIGYTFSTRDTSKIKIEIDPQSPAHVAVYMLDAESNRKLQQLAAGQHVSGEIKPIRASDQQGRVVFEDVSLSSGEYCVVTENHDSVTVAVNYKISEYR